ncbi:GH14588 [Drosophila grimshawi]|uniref:GH14588 n=1 Tax=Drosophila grimshawi TaxID=7222 RepID=B4IYG6_DROGR|nr:GH14588 [Drosophila grimshawi]
MPLGCKAHAHQTLIFKLSDCHAGHSTIRGFKSGADNDDDDDDDDIGDRPLF